MANNRRGLEPVAEQKVGRYRVVVVAGIMRRIFSEEQWQALDRESRYQYHILGVFPTLEAASRKLQAIADLGPTANRHRPAGNGRTG